MLSMVNLVVGSTAKAREHHDLVRRFSKLESDIICKPTPSEEEMAQLECKRIEIEADEPPKLAVLDAMCHNELLVAENASFESYSDIGFFQRLFSDLGDISPSSLRTRSQKREDQAAQAPKAKPANT